MPVVAFASVQGTGSHVPSLQMYKAFIERDLEKAEIKVMNNFNPFAGFKEPVQILKTSNSVSVDAAYDVLKKLFPNSEVSKVCNEPPPSCTACAPMSAHNPGSSYSFHCDHHYTCSSSLCLLCLCGFHRGFDLC